MIDNYDSFTFNLVHYFRALGQEVEVHRNNKISIEEIGRLAPDYIVLSPGPGEPNDAGISLAVIDEFLGKIPILGVCLGHQCIAQHFGTKIIKAKKVMHGKTSLIKHQHTGIFEYLNNPLQVTRYHSLIVEPNKLSQELTVTAWTESATGGVDEIMAIAHKTLPIIGVQFHPESVLTDQGEQLLNNFISLYNNNNING